MNLLPDAETRLFDDWSLPVMVLNRELRFAYANTAYCKMTFKRWEDLEGQYMFDAFPDTQDRVASVLERFERTLAGEVTVLDAQPFNLEMEDGSYQEVVWQATQDPIRDINGNIIGLLQHAQNISQQYQLEQRNIAITHELSHRVRNIMAIVSSVARITGRNATDVPNFVKSFTSRLNAMSRTNDLLSESDWAGLNVTTIFKDELTPFMQAGDKRLTLDGPPVRLSVDASKDLSMVCHELATNAVKYGCLGKTGGDLSVRWRRSADELIIDWQETCPHPIQAAGETGFGTRLFDMLPYVEVERNFTPTGLHLTITIDGEKAFA